MSKKVMIWLISAAALVVLGAILSAAALSFSGWNLSKPGTVSYAESIHEIDGEFRNISFYTDTADILFTPSADGVCRVICREPENEKHSVFVDGDTLTVTLKNTRKWYEYIGISFGSPKITVYLPAGEYGALCIKGSTGDIELSDAFSFGEIDISASTGDVRCFASSLGDIKIKLSTGDIFADGISADGLDMSVSTGRVSASYIDCGDVTLHVTAGKANLSNIACCNFISDGNTGDIALENVVASGRFDLERSTGDVRLWGCDAAEIFIETDTGDVTGSFISKKIFLVESDTGRIDVPHSASGGICEVETDTGDIRLNFLEEAE